MIGLTKEFQKLEAVFRSLEAKAEKREREIEAIEQRAVLKKRALTQEEQARKKTLLGEIVELEVLKNRTADLMGQIE